MLLVLTEAQNKNAFAYLQAIDVYKPICHKLPLDSKFSFLKKQSSPLERTRLEKVYSFFLLKRNLNKYSFANHGMP